MLRLRRLAIVSAAALSVLAVVVGARRRGAGGRRARSVRCARCGDYDSGAARRRRARPPCRPPLRHWIRAATAAPDREPIVQRHLPHRPGLGRSDEPRPDRHVRRLAVAQLRQPGIQRRFDDDRPERLGRRHRSARAQHDRRPAGGDEARRGDGRGQGGEGDASATRRSSCRSAGSSGPASQSTSGFAYTATLRSSITGSNWLFTRANGIIDAYRWIPWVSRRVAFDRPNHGDPFVTPVEPARAGLDQDRSDARHRHDRRTRSRSAASARRSRPSTCGTSS